MDLLTRFTERTEFSDYEDFKNNFKLIVPPRFDYARDVIDAWAEAEPDKTAIIYVDDAGNEKLISFGELSLLSKQAAAYFHKLGINKGDRVLTLMRRRWEYWAAAIALHRMGAVVVPCSVQMRAKDIAYRLNACAAKYVIAVNDEYVIHQLEGMQKKCHSLKGIIIAGENMTEGRYHLFNSEFTGYGLYEEESSGENSDEFIIYFTSGTSGYPKMAIHNRTYPLAHIVTAKYMQRVQNGGLHLTQADSGWAKFGWGNLYGQFICGTAVLAYDPLRFDSVKLLEIMQKYRPTSLCVPPTMYRLLLRDGLKAEHVASIKWFSTAGEPLAQEVNERFHDITGSYIRVGYGQSEGTPITCTFEWCDARECCMGRPSPLYDVMLLNDNGEGCAPYEHGEVVIHITDKNAPGLLMAYGADKKYLNPIENDIYHTGDIAYRDENGDYWYVSRNDDMIKSSGYRIGPFEIESVLNTHPAVKESAIIGRADDIRGQKICAVIVLNPDYEPSDTLTKELQDYVKANTAPYKYPRVVEYIDSLPKTTSGKIMRKAL